jgi:hypothetical protein
LQVLPTIGRQLREEDFSRIKEVIDDTLSNESYGVGRENAKSIAWQYPGEAAKRVVDYLCRKSA